MGIDFKYALFNKEALSQPSNVLAWKEFFINSELLENIKAKKHEFVKFFASNNKFIITYKNLINCYFEIIDMQRNTKNVDFKTIWLATDIKTNEMLETYQNDKFKDFSLIKTNAKSYEKELLKNFKVFLKEYNNPINNIESCVVS